METRLIVDIATGKLVDVLEMVVSRVRQLTWAHFIALILLKDPLQRELYAEMCRIERWSVRALRSRIDSMLYERTALSKRPDKFIEQDIKALREEDRLTRRQLELRPTEEVPVGR